jgi:hypothetical protein
MVSGVELVVAFLTLPRYDSSPTTPLDWNYTKQTFPIGDLVHLLSSPHPHSPGFLKATHSPLHPDQRSSVLQKTTTTHPILRRMMPITN